MNMGSFKNVFADPWGITGVGAIIGVLAPLLQRMGNPGNMGICVACFDRDIAGALGLHRADMVQYMRPEIIGFVLGSLVAAYLFKEFRPRAGSAPVVRFVLGAFAMIGALVFLGCPWRALLRLAGGVPADLSMLSLLMSSSGIVSPQAPSASRVMRSAVSNTAFLPPAVRASI